MRRSSGNTVHAAREGHIYIVASWHLYMVYAARKILYELYITQKTQFPPAESVGAVLAADTFVTLAGTPPRLWVGGLLSAQILGICLPVLPSNCQIRTVIYANWQERACRSVVICGKTIIGTMHRGKSKGSTQSLHCQSGTLNTLSVTNKHSNTVHWTGAAGSLWVYQERTQLLLTSSRYHIDRFDWKSTQWFALDDIINSIDKKTIWMRWHVSQTSQTS